MVWAAAVPGIMAAAITNGYPGRMAVEESENDDPYVYTEREMQDAIAHLAAELAEAKQKIEELEIELEMSLSEAYGDNISYFTTHSTGIKPKQRGNF